jgi:hypothetical protein
MQSSFWTSREPTHADATAQTPRVSFAPATPTDLGARDPKDVAMADLNQDGHLDMILTFGAFNNPGEGAHRRRDGGAQGRGTIRIFLVYMVSWNTAALPHGPVTLTARAVDADTASATDNVDGAAPVTCAPPSGSTLPWA